MEKTTKTEAPKQAETPKTAAAWHGANAHKTDVMAPVRAMFEAAGEEYQAGVDRWMEFGAAQAAEGFRVAKTLHAGTMSAVKSSVDAWSHVMADVTSGLPADLKMPSFEGAPFASAREIAEQVEKASKQATEQVMSFATDAQKQAEKLWKTAAGRAS